jgi:2-oxo-4-hydroxy-4-carboxy--5-ureidoimidazoline (OHCU) decarboxylase
MIMEESRNVIMRRAFFTAANVLFETAPPLARRLWEARGQMHSYSVRAPRARCIHDAFSHGFIVRACAHMHTQDLIDAADRIMRELSGEDRLAVINAHPRIGVDPAKESLSALSFIEQACALRRLHRCASCFLLGDAGIHAATRPRVWRRSATSPPKNRRRKSSACTRGLPSSTRVRATHSRAEVRCALNGTVQRTRTSSASSSLSSSRAGPRARLCP